MASIAFAQEAPLSTPSMAPSAVETASPSPLAPVIPTPIEAATASPPAPPADSSSPPPSGSTPVARNVRISFLPPPLEGKISLGIYNEGKQLVRVLQREADFDKFTVGDDALITKWDGKSDDGQDAPAGKYRARGYLVGNLKSEKASNSTTPPNWQGEAIVSVRLVPNPLFKDERGKVELGVGFDNAKSFLKTADGLPVYTLEQKTNITRACLQKNGEKAIDVWLDDGAVVEQVRVTNVDKMMAFDCGDFDLK
jgi:hypothetical protein